MEMLYYLLLAVYGVAIGSFLCCQVRRKVFREGDEKGASGGRAESSGKGVRKENVRNAESSGKGVRKGDVKLGKRSVCMNCGYQLRWYDNIPIVSWLMLGGKCRKCKKKIGVAEILAEVGGGVGFVAVGMLFSRGVLAGEAIEIVRLVVGLGFAGVLLYLAIFDGITGEMPVGALTILNACAIMEVILRERSLILSSVLAGVVFGGIYYLLYKLSRERFVGGGDWIVALAIGLFVGDLYQAIWVLFLSNFFAAVVGLTMKQKKLRLVPYFFVGFLISVVFFVDFF